MIFNIEIEDAGKRLDIFILEKLKGILEISRSNLANQIPDCVTINGESVRKGKELKVNDIVEINLEELKGNMVKEAEDLIEAVNGSLDIMEETDEYIVLNKQGGVAVHPGYKNENNTIANYLKAYLEGKGQYDPSIKRAGIVHRLDKPVSGILICAKTRTMQLYLQKQFENHEVVKLYLAKIENKELISDIELESALTSFKENNYIPTDEWELVEGKIERDSSNRMKMKLGEHGKDSITYLLPLINNEILVNIKTGRMHQIRATLKSKNMIISGDALYGSKDPKEAIELKQIFMRLKISDNTFKEWSL